MPRPRTSTARKQKVLSLNKTRSPTRTSWRKESKIITNFFLLFVNDPTIAQLNDAFPIRSVFVRVCDLHDGHAFVIELAKQLHDFLALTGVQISRRFISEQKLRFSDDCPGHTYDLLLSAG